MNRPIRLLSPLFALALLVPTAACSGAPPSSPSSAEQHLGDAIPTKGAVWLTCWFTPAGEGPFARYELACSGPTDPKYPLQLRGLNAEVQGAGGADLTGFLVAPGSTDGASATRELGALDADKFPAKLIVQAAWPTFSGAAMGSQLGSTVLRMESTIDRPDSFTRDRPLVVRQPFDLWPITVVSKTSEYSLSHEHFTLPLDGFTASAGAGSMDVDGKAEPSQDGVGSRTFYVVAPPSGHLLVHYQTPSVDAHVTLDGPGTYLAEAATLRAATANDSLEPAPTPPSAPRPCGGVNQDCCGGSETKYGTCQAGLTCYDAVLAPNDRDTCM